jgi:metal-responsive CopG/Arc/MetJ family transcriptional regulator
MVRPREIKGSPRPVSLNLEDSLYTEFEKTLPRNKSVSEAIREYMQETLDERKKLEAPAERLPIFTSDVRQTTLNEYNIIYIYNLVESSDEDLESALHTIPSERTTEVYDKLTTMRSILFHMDYPKICQK